MARVAQAGSRRSVVEVWCTFANRPLADGRHAWTSRVCILATFESARRWIRRARTLKDDPLYLRKRETRALYVEAKEILLDTRDACTRHVVLHPRGADLAAFRADDRPRFRRGQRVGLVLDDKYRNGVVGDLLRGMSSGFRSYEVTLDGGNKKAAPVRVVEPLLVPTRGVRS